MSMSDTHIPPFPADRPDRSRRRPSRRPAPETRLKVVEEDEDYLVIDKPAGLLSIATDKENTRTAFRIVSDMVKRRDPRNRIFVVHRLDRETSGLMLFAKSQEAQSAIQHHWKSHILRRRYITIVEGKMQTGDGSGYGVIRSYLRESKARMVYSSPNPRNGVPAVTHYHILYASERYSMLSCELETGRKNQIRVQLQGIGHPVAGDLKYGGQPTPMHRLALHAFELSFTNPRTGKSHHLISPLPDSFYLLDDFPQIG